jgi:hypothetical protein
MAIWSYEILLLPENELVEVCGNVPNQLADKFLEEFDWWYSQQPAPTTKEQIGRCLPPMKSWSSDLVLWGTEGGDRFQLVLDNNKVVEVTAFVDARDINMKFINCLLDIAYESKAMLVTHDYVVISPEKSLLMERIECSKAFEFAQNPTAFLSRQKTKRSDSQ